MNISTTLVVLVVTSAVTSVVTLTVTSAVTSVVTLVEVTAQFGSFYLLKPMIFFSIS